MTTTMTKKPAGLRMPNRYTWGTSLLLVLTLIVFWQIPGTIALRNIALSLLLVSLIWQQVQQPQRPNVELRLQWKSSAALLLIVLTAWMLWVIEYRSPVAPLSIREFCGQWLIPLGCWVCGVLLGTVANAYGANWACRVVTLVFVGLLFQVLLHDILDIWFWYETGNLPFRQAPVFYMGEIVRSLLTTGSVEPAFSGTFPDKFSYVNNTCAALLIAEFVQRTLTKKPYMPIARNWLLLAAVAILLCSFTLRMRNGNVGLLLLAGMTSIFVLLRVSKEWSKLKLFSIVVAFLIGMTSFVWIAYKSDARWLAFSESVVLALDTENNRAWLDVEIPYPLMNNGEPVDQSAYERLAWGKEGVKLIFENPLGLGYNRNAFGVGIEQVYHQKPRSLHAHSGLVDFTIANGLPGLVLWLAFLGVLAWTGWAAFSSGNVAIGLMLMFLVSSFFGRSIVDSNLRDHILQQFLFLVGLFHTFCRADIRQSVR